MAHCRVVKAIKQVYNPAKIRTPARSSVSAPLEPEFVIPSIRKTRATIPMMCKSLNRRTYCFSLSGPSVLTRSQSSDEGAMFLNDSHDF